MLDSDLARLYGVPTKALLQAVKRNANRFPIDFAYQLTLKEFAALRSQFVTSNPGRGGRRTPPWAFTQEGVAMLSSVLRSPQAVQANIQIMRAFVRLRELLATNETLARRLDELQQKVDDHSVDLAAIFEAIKQLISVPEPEPREMGYHTLLPRKSDP